MSEKVFVLGGEQTDFQRNWTKEGKTFMSMMREVLDDALEKVGISYDEIKRLNKENKVAVFVGNFDAEQYANQGHLGAFLTEVNPALFGVPGARYEAACASGSVALDAAITHIRAEDYDLAIVLGVEVMKTVSSSVGGDFLGTAAYYEKEAKGVQFPFPKLFGKLADVILERYELKEERFMDALAEISRINYANAKRNPKAQTRTWFMNKEHAMARGGDNNMAVGGRLCITDCSQVTDGAAVTLLASKGYAKEYAKKTGRKFDDIPRIKGWGHRVAPITFEAKKLESVGDKYILPWTRQTVKDAYKRADLDVKNIDVFETHDCFTSSEYAAISAFGISEPGKEHIAIEEGTIDFGGKKPINPSGGLIGVGHPVGASGVRMMLDLYKQVTGTAGDYQVKGAKNGLMLNIGGSATTNFVFILGK
ncbi:acetyl-CoA acetyltransferase [Leptospira meyeri]|uniref:Acetyl-CoA C-acetyltransferase n=1 Tax=Leptospira meyeri TaxID=29508 RepID=A0A4R8N028_LEPME|nr:acetyl-CoA acetyltransferase [Leptospira meyeri]EKJ86429.1 thiolase, C-terminal domain protein [Leptospira meyeri serovar Hardjo str. Went 5]EMJ89352.1 thiolase, C-terminal domain protein [Leptospira meyeri serovar Semaranga str. Veldrot Semarang 173]TDY72645.1 acetyl-CoA C-acetyltransferase [Leptospira meyeri]TGL46998.1 thiolase domain-containing protein [Leptospira meyeri]TGM64585.1 thiolase domain-containing protein [Leptospira meyeri]